MDESAALETTAVRAVDTADRERVLWSDADREWASRAAAAIVGERASAEEFLGRRAQLVLERVGTRQPAVTRTVRGMRWRPWAGVVTVVAAFVLGVLIDRIGGGSSTNLLAPPVFALVVWNLVVYVWLLVRPLVLRRGAAAPMRSFLIRAASVGPPARAGERMPRLPPGAPCSPRCPASGRASPHRSTDVRREAARGGY